MNHHARGQGQLERMLAGAGEAEFAADQAGLLKAVQAEYEKELNR